MNEFLAELYGTREMVGAEDSSDVEKLAEAQILDDVLQSEGINVDDLDNDTILKLAHEIFGGDSELVKSAMKEEDESEEEEASEDEAEEEESSEEKTAEADMLGRIMAHSMVQELGNIEQEKEASVGQAVKNWGQLAAHGAKSGGSAVAGKAKSLKNLAKGKAKAMKGTFKDSKEGLIPGTLRKSIGGGKGNLKSLGDVAKGHKKTVGAAAALGTAGAAGGTYAATKKKKAPAIDKLAEGRALEILAENGITPDDGQDKLASAIEQRAWEMLAENGYVQE